MAFALIFKKSNGVQVNIVFWMSLELTFFFGIFGFLEWRHRRIAAQQDPFVQPNTFLTLEEFTNLVEKGRQLVILDDLVLDVAPFLHCHPGGLWNIKHNIGKDISKFFYGGYSIDGNEDGRIGKSG